LIFAKYFVPVFNIEKRYLGSETDPVTLKYNRALIECLKDAATVIPRLEIEGKAVSASLVRRLYEEKDFAGLSRLVPETTLEYLKTR
jgi:[citrate (pro-3S)-lyase] ligase